MPPVYARIFILPFETRAEPLFLLRCNFQRWNQNIWTGKSRASDSVLGVHQKLVDAWTEGASAEAQAEGASRDQGSRDPWDSTQAIVQPQQKDIFERQAKAPGNALAAEVPVAPWAEGNEPVFRPLTALEPRRGPAGVANGLGESPEDIALRERDEENLVSNGSRNVPLVLEWR